MFICSQAEDLPEFKEISDASLCLYAARLAKAHREIWFKLPESTRRAWRKGEREIEIEQHRAISLLHAQWARTEAFLVSFASDQEQVADFIKLQSAFVISTWSPQRMEHRILH